jgi:predicted O-methyltransferase YrrM
MRVTGFLHERALGCTECQSAVLTDEKYRGAVGLPSSQESGMKFDEIASIVGKVPFISRKNSRYLYDLILRERLTSLLELGIAHGTATCFMAAALQELGEGTVTAVDLIEAADSFRPSAEEQLERAGLTDFARVVRTQTGYTWFLHDEIARNTADGMCREVYDLCIIDGPKNWTIDGAAFFFVDKLLKLNGWIIFDDYHWTYASANAIRDSTDGITHRSLSKDEQETPHIREIVELLVRQHQHYGKLVILDDGDWVLAQKTMTRDRTIRAVYRETAGGIAARIVYKARRAFKRLRKRP